jgi:hypothetical protein
MQNKLSDLNNYLFAQIERLSDESINGDELKMEIERAKALGLLSRNVLDGARLIFDAVKLAETGIINKNAIPDIIQQSK